MAITRTNAVDYLKGLYGSGAGNLLGAANVPATDTLGGLKEPINDALLGLGTSWTALPTATVEDSETARFLAILRLATLERILAGLNAKTQLDLKAGDVELKGSQLVAKVERMRARAEAEVIALGGTSAAANAGGGGWGLTTLSLGIVEPEGATT